MPTPIIRTIHARLNHPQAGAQYRDCYCFDDPENDLVAEPFVHSATAAIAALCRCLTFEKQPPESVLLRACAADPTLLGPLPDRTVSAALTLLGPDGDGHLYRPLVLDPEDAVFAAGINFEVPDLWLCPVLPLYFGGAPEHLYVHITPAPNPTTEPAADARS